MRSRARKQTYLPDPATIERLAAEIHEENLHREFVVEDDTSRIDRRGGPRLLLLAIVKNAVNTLEEWGRRYNSFCGRPYEFAALRRNAQSAFRFLTSNECDHITRFRAICDETGADADAVREMVFAHLVESALKVLFQTSPDWKTSPDVHSRSH